MASISAVRCWGRGEGGNESGKDAEHWPVALPRRAPPSRPAPAERERRGCRAQVAGPRRQAAERRTTVAAVSLARLRARPALVAPIASARTPEELAELLPGASLCLTDGEVTRLNGGSA